MAKKVYDVKPPKVARKTEKSIKQFLAEEKKTTIRRQERPQARRKKESKPVWVPLSAGLGVVILIALVILFFKLPKADITIWPKVEVLSYEQSVVADKEVSAVDDSGAVIPAKYFEATKTDSQEFDATGSGTDGGYASGTITIYNKYDPPTAFTFKAGTRFISDSGKIFKASSKVVIPAATKSGSKIVPGSVQVKVQAMESGDSYNIAPSNFSVPGLKGTSSYYSIYATSTEAMAGGYSGKVKKVTADDITSAKDAISKSVNAGAMSDLKAQIPSEYVLLDDAVSSSVTSSSTEVKSGTVVDKFAYKATAKATGIAFKKSDLEKYVKNHILSQISGGKTLLEDNLKIDYLVDKADVSEGKLTMKVNFSSGVYQSINTNSLTLSVLGENSSQISDTINNSLGDQVSKVKVNFWPFWVTSAPSNQKAIHINLKFE